MPKMYFTSCLGVFACLAMTCLSGVPTQNPNFLNHTNTPPDQTDNAFQNTVLTRTNGYRQANHAQPLIWNATLAEYAQSHVNKCIWKHTVSPHYTVSSSQLI